MVVNKAACGSTRHGGFGPSKKGVVAVLRKTGREGSLTMLPSDFLVHEGEATPFHLTAAFGKSEAEFVAVVMLRAMARHGNDFGAVSLDEMWPDIERSGLVRARIIDPIVGRVHLEKHNWIVCDPETLMLSITSAALERLRPYARDVAPP